MRTLATLGLGVGFMLGFCWITGCAGGTPRYTWRDPRQTQEEVRVVCDDDGWCRRVVRRTLGGMVLK